MRFKITHSENNDRNCLDITVEYHLGGYSVVTHQDVQRGYYLDVQPLCVGGHLVTASMFSGVSYLLEKAARMSRNKLDRYNTEDSIRALIKEHDVELWCKANGYDVAFD